MTTYTPNELNRALHADLGVRVEEFCDGPRYGLVFPADDCTRAFPGLCARGYHWSIPQAWAEGMVDFAGDLRQAVALAELLQTRWPCLSITLQIRGSHDRGFRTASASLPGKEYLSNGPTAAMALAKLCLTLLETYPALADGEPYDESEWPIDTTTSRCYTIYLNRKERLMLKMYILILDDVPAGLAINAAAHASLAGYLHFIERPEMQEWVRTSFRKVTCAITPAQFSQAQAQPDGLVITEKALDGRAVGIVFCPREEWPTFFKFLTMYGKGDTRVAPAAPAPELTDSEYRLISELGLNDPSK
jgi:hypothetical protein